VHHRVDNGFFLRDRGMPEIHGYALNGGFCISPQKGALHKFS
jgi:hypothetical protein